jgi:O-antigen ligase
MIKRMFSTFRLRNPVDVGIALIGASAAAAAGVALGWGKSGWIIVILSGLAGCLAIVRRPALGVALILALAPLEDFLIIQGQTAVMLAALLVAAIFAVQVAIRRRLLVDSTAVMAAALIMWALATILWSPDKDSSASNWISFALVGLLYLLLINLIESKEDLKLALWGHVIGGSILSLIVTKALMAHDFARSEFVLGYGINLVSRLIGLNLLLSMLLYELERHFLRKVALFLAAVLAGIGVAVTLSRGTWLGVLASVVILGLTGAFSGRRRLPVGKLLLLCLGGVILIYILNTYLFDQHGLWKLTERFQSGVTLSDSGGGRLKIWRVAWQVFTDAPIWGHGYNSFKYEYTRYLDTGGDIKNAHNAYVLMGCELGMVGVVLFIAVLLTVFAKVWRLFSAKGVNGAAIAPWCMALFAFVFVATMVDSAVERKYVWYTLGLITLLTRFYSDTQSTDNRAFPRA